LLNKNKNTTVPKSKIFSELNKALDYLQQPISKHETHFTIWITHNKEDIDPNLNFSITQPKTQPKTASARGGGLQGRSGRAHSRQLEGEVATTVGEK
jgi:hypothetical protein